MKTKSKGKERTISGYICVAHNQGIFFEKKMKESKAPKWECSECANIRRIVKEELANL